MILSGPLPPEHEVTGSNLVGRTGSKVSNHKGLLALGLAEAVLEFTAK
jgi:hypothetical protein